MNRKPEPELMDLPDEVAAYARANFAEVNRRFVDDAVAHVSRADAVAVRRRLLDVGCGPGDITAMLARRLPDWDVVGVDTSGPISHFSMPMQKVLQRSAVGLTRSSATAFCIIFPSRAGCGRV
jgi:tRNA G46 methylase TrmB